MRIRKRQVPFPLSPATLSDPNLINRSPVLVQLSDATTTSPKPSCTHASATAPISLSDRPQPSDQSLPRIGKPTNGCDNSLGEGGAHRVRHQKKQECLVENGRGQDGGGGHKGNDTRKGSISGAEMSTEVLSPSSPSRSASSSKQEYWRWCEGDKAFPLKKRRGSFDNNINNDNGKKKMKVKSRMKTTMNNKCYDSNEGDQEEEVVVVVRETKPEVNVGKKKVRGGALMEGSRCSRVNGRGWRCCQPTLVGYSLCEHHLGKGRLRSMTSVRSRSVATAPKNNNIMLDMPLSESSSLSLETQTKYECKDNDEIEKKPSMITTKKRMKLGVVKARSISSLLGQTNTEISIAENNKCFLIIYQCGQTCSKERDSSRWRRFGWRPYPSTTSQTTRVMCSTQFLQNIHTHTHICGKRERRSNYSISNYDISYSA